MLKRNLSISVAVITTSILTATTGCAHGDGGPDRHLAEIYDLKEDPDERVNRINDARAAATLAELKEELNRLMTDLGLTPQNDRIPIDEGIKMELPDQKIR